MTPDDAQGGASGAGARAVYEARVERIHEHTSDTRSLFLGLSDGSQFGFIPGQFISIQIALPDGPRVRPYSIASNPEDGQPLEICFNLVTDGPASHYLFGLEVGARLNFTGPFGMFTLDRAPDCETVFIAETAAIAPIRPMIHRATAVRAHPPYRLIHVAPSGGALIYRSEFEAIAQRDRAFVFEPIIAPLDPARAHNPTVVRELVQARYIRGDSNRTRRFFLCGVGKAVLELRDMLRGAGYERRAVQYEQW